MSRFLRRRVLPILVGLLLLPFPGLADVYLQVGGQGRSQPLIPLAFPPFIAGTPATAASAQTARAVEGVVRDDLLFSRYFNILENGPHFDGSNLGNLAAGWKARGASWVLTVGVTDVRDQLSAEVQLLNAGTGDLALSRYYRQKSDYLRSLAHRISDDIVHQLTGKVGVAHTWISFANDQTGHKEIYMMDYDGANLRRLTADNSICLLPRFSPERSLLVFTSYRDGNPDLFGIDLAAGRRRIISNDQGLNIAGGFSSDGEELLMTLSRERNPNLYIKNLGDGSLTRLTENFGTDSSPTFSPDASQVAFVSDRSGNPQIYLLDMTTMRATRLTSLNWCDSPTWSPTGAWIAFSGRTGPMENLDIYLVDVTGSQIRRLTHGEGSNENPSWSPDGRFILFSSTRNGRSQIFVMDADGSAPHILSDIPGNSITPTWSE